ncbi:MAG: hypothetical protein NTY35_17690 [Planctomycetota bacterium]|nr:hypothetical protein [Planctomycetota bacterium]
MNARLAFLAARRLSASGLVLAALALCVWIAVGSGTASDLASNGGARDAAARAGAWTEACWTTFLALVAPCIALRAASLRSRGEVAWTSVSRSGGARGEASLATGALVAVLGLTAVWSAFVALGPGAPERVPGFAGRVAGPAKPLVDHERPLAWRVSMPAEPGLRARIEVSLSITPGGGGEVQFTARRARSDSSVDVHAATGRALVLPRGGVDVDVPGGEGEVEFELSLPEPGARGYVASDDVTLWRAEPAAAPKLRIAARAVLAVAAWAVLAFGLGAWLTPLLALGLLASAWCALWWTEAWRLGAAIGIPGAGLARDLAIVAEGRAPSSLAAGEFATAIACVLVGLLLCRRGPEGRP